MDWVASATGIKSVSSQLREVFAVHLGRVIAKVVDVRYKLILDGFSVQF